VVDSSLQLPSAPWIVAHRGSPQRATENTLASVRLAVEEGADMVEVDLQLSADGELLVVHDEELERLAGVPWRVEATPWRQLSRLTLIGPGAPAERRIPTLGELLEAVPAEVALNLELKRRQAPRETLVEALAAAVGERRQLLVSSFDWALLGAVRAGLPRLPVAPLADRGGDRVLAAAAALGAWGIHLSTRMAGRRRVAAAAAAGRPTLVYTVNRPAVAERLFARGVCGVFTDRPGALRAALSSGRDGRGNGPGSMVD